MLHKERENQNNIVSRLSEYRSWVDKFISNEVEHPWNSSGMDKYGNDDDQSKVSNSTDMPRIVEVNKARKKISPKFNPFKLADHIFFNGLNPTNQLSQDELDLVEMVMEYHSKTKYDYAAEMFVDDESTKYAYYKELEFCEYVKLVMFVMNNLN
jgi:hypothetical protein